MGSSKYLILQNTTMAEGKQSIKNKFIKPFVALFRKNKKDKATTNKNATTNRNATANRNATTNQSATTNERREEAPFDNLLKKLEELEINKRARLENAAANIDNDNDSICDSDNETDKGLGKKFDKQPENDVTTPHNARNDVTTSRDTRNDVTTPHKTDDDSACDSEDDHAELLEKFNHLEIVKKEVTQVEEDEEELKKFSTKIVPDDVRTLRNDSQSSQDSGFAEKSSAIGSDEENLDKDVDRIEEKGLDGEKKEVTKQKKLQKAYLKRGPVKSKRSQARPSAPYEINLNPQHHCGGQVIFNAQPNFDLTPEGLDIDSLFSEDSTYESLINSVLSKDEINTCVNALQYDLQSQFDPIFNSNSSPIQNDFNSNSSPIQNDFDSNSSPIHNNFNTNSNSSSPSHFNLISSPQLSIPEVELPPQYEDINENVLRDLDPYVLTPPSSVNSHFMYSPQNRNIESPLKSIDTSPESPALSLNDGLEQFGEIASNDQYFTNSPPFDPQTEGTTPQNTLESPKLVYEKLKHYKDRQMELAKQFSKMECCQIILKPCKEIFNEHLQKLQEGERKKLCYSVANLELQFAFGVLMNTLSDLSKSELAEDVKMALFCLVCEKVLSAQKTLFVEDFGLKLLKFAVLRCYKRPVITRYLVECVRVVTRSAAYRPESDTVFTEVDALGDNLLIACVREGDKCASALRELVRCGDDDAPLFDVHHVNTDGYTALHVCCAGHGARTSRAHTLHVLLQHAAADRRRQDRKGGETPLHLAVNSAQCELDMVLIFFQVDRKDWYSLAHIENRSGKNPLEYAKFGKKSRPNYPPEILDFLVRCRK